MALQELAASPPQAVIFDIGRVIIRVNLERAFAPLAATLAKSQPAQGRVMKSPQEIWAALQRHRLWNGWQEGRVSPEEWHEAVVSLLRIPLGFDEFCAAWNMALDPDVILDESLFLKLGERCRLGLLSNTDPLHSEYIETNFSFTRHFPARIYSCRVGISKPASAIYREALRAVGAPSRAALYIDDVPEFAEAARGVGMDAVLFESPAELVRQLGLRGLMAT